LNMTNSSRRSHDNGDLEPCSASTIAHVLYALSRWSLSDKQQISLIEYHSNNYLLIRTLLRIDRLCSDVFCNDKQAKAFMHRKGAFSFEKELSPIDFFFDENSKYDQLLRLMVDKAYSQFDLHDPTPILVAHRVSSFSLFKQFRKAFNDPVALNTWLINPMENSKLFAPIDYLLQIDGEQKLARLLGNLK